ncbi:uncharacterized protein BXZ73DRAFT_101213 [Epithele typhae]|uniref:uncharacterized protein n=1 Tax=Epithele typhae TaxID=378194 RepID=UPI0020085F2F|nr:uncharacterized protein BXZ73DRAFT_101213 [Epithele typhae]KAH9933253.1 hypothetical protein BXZ73DRAFT_101213 [Epithele typhae]
MGLLDETSGATLVSLVVESTLFGITLLQTFFYFRNYANDRWYIKGLVIFLTTLDTLHVVLCLHAVYWYLVTNFGNVANLDNTVWSLDLQVEANTVIAVVVECFFARRLYIMSKNWILAGTVVILALIHISTGLVFTVKAFTLGHFSKFTTLKPVIVLGLVAPAVADILIAGSMCYYLYRKRTGLSRTDSIVTALMVYSVNSGLTTSIIASACVITFLAMPTNLIWIAFFWLLGKCYVNSFLALLNSREQLRERSGRGGVVALSDFAANGSGGSGGGAGSGGGLSHARRALPNPKGGVGAPVVDVEIGISRTVIERADDAHERKTAGDDW